MHTRLLSGIALASAALMLSPAIPAFAHETGAIHVSTSQVAVGGTVGVRGEKLPKSSELKLQLRGILDNYPTGSVKTDTAGAFQTQLTVPQNVPAGAYTLVVIASDGDVTARADLQVSAPTSVAAGGAAQPPGQPPGMAGMPGMSDHDAAGMAGEHATAEAMAIPRTTTPIQWAIIWGVIGVSLVAGATLLKRAATLSGRA